MGFEFISQRLPASVHVLVEQSFLDGHEQVVCQQTEENVCIDAPLELMMYGPQHQRALHVAKCVLGAAEQHVETPCLVGGQIRAVAAQQVAAVERIQSGIV